MDWERLLTAAQLVVYGGFILLALAFFVVWLYEKCTTDERYMVGFVMIVCFIILTLIVYFILGSLS
jgi:uncharacterized membrane protein (DUF485 family)